MRAARVAWVLAGVTFLLVLADGVVTAEYHHLMSEEAVAEHGFPFVDGAVLGCALMGALIVSTDPRHLIGWLLSVVGPLITGLAMVSLNFHWVTDAVVGAAVGVLLLGVVHALDAIVLSRYVRARAGRQAA